METKMKNSYILFSKNISQVLLCLSEIFSIIEWYFHLRFISLGVLHGDELTTRNSSEFFKPFVADTVIWVKTTIFCRVNGVSAEWCK